MTELVLYTYWRSSSAYRVRLALAVKGVSYRAVTVNLLEQAQRTPAHVARSPMGVVPCLEIDGESFVESAAILELLEDLHPAPALLPRDPLARAHVRALVQIVNAGTQPLQNLHVLEKLSSDPAVKKEWIVHFIGKGLTAFEALMAANEARGVRGRFAYGDEVTMADCFLVPQVYNARRYEMDLARFPRLRAAADAFGATEAGRVSAPDAQPDAPRA